MPLPGVTPAQVLSQLAHRLFGPLRPKRTRIVLDYHGLLGRPAGSAADIARRHHVTAPTVRNNAAAVRTAGARQPLTPQLVVESERASTPEDDHLGRVRIAATLGLARPEPPSAVRHSPAGDNDTVPAAMWAVARAGVRILAAVGPLTLPVLAAAVARARRFRERHHLSNGDLAAALRLAGCTVDADGRWHALIGTPTSKRNQAIVTLAAGRDLTRQQMIHILLTAGYSRSSAEGRMSSSHPLFERTGHDRYRLIGSFPLAGPTQPTSG